MTFRAIQHNGREAKRNEGKTAQGWRGLKCRRVVLGLLVGVLLTGIVLSAQRPARREPIAYIGHGAMFDQSGEEIVPSIESIRDAQAWYKAELPAKLERNQRAEFDKLERFLTENLELDDQARLIADAQLIDWLIATAKVQDGDRMRGKNNLMKMYLQNKLAAKAGKNSPRSVEPYTADPMLLERIAPLSNKISGAISAQPLAPGIQLTSVDSKGSEYISKCKSSFVPAPDMVGGAGWTDEGEIPKLDLFTSASLTAQVLTFKSASPQGMCFALQRFDDKNMVQRSDVICLGRGLSNACFWDARIGEGKKPFPRGTAVPLSGFGGGTDLSSTVGGVCSDCHSGENPFIITGSKVLQRLANDPAKPHFGDSWYRPLVRAPWPENPGPKATSPGLCHACHVQGVAGRFPKLSGALLPGYCGSVLKQSIYRSMPPFAPGSMADTPEVKELLMQCGGNGTSVSLTSSPNPSQPDQPVTFTVRVTDPAGGQPDGSVAILGFFGGRELGTANVTRGLGTVSVSNFAAGSHHVFARFRDASGSVTDSVNIVQVVMGMTTTLTMSPTQPVPGQSIRLIATVTSSDGNTPTGTIRFLDNSQLFASPALIGGQASADLIAKSGSHAVTAEFHSTTGFPDSTGTIQFVVAPASTVTTLTTSPNPSAPGQPVTITVKVTDPLGDKPSGGVTIKDNGNSLGGPYIVTGGQAILSGVAFATAGRHQIDAVFTPDPGWLTSSATYTHVVLKTTTTLTMSPRQPVNGQPISYLATVTSSDGRTPEGSVDFLDNSKLAGSAPVSGGKASISVSAVYGGHFVTAEFHGINGFPDSRSDPALGYAPGDAPTITTLTPSSFTVEPGQSVIFTVKVDAPQGGQPSGLVFFKEGTSTFGTATVTNGKATYATPFPRGSHTISAVFSAPTGGWVSSPSNTVNVDVKASKTTTTITSSLNPGYKGKYITFTATVTTPGSEMPVGTLTWKDNGVLLIAPNKILGVGGLQILLDTGRHNITADFAGDPGWPNSSGSFTEDVSPGRSTETSLQSSPNPSAPGQQFNVTARITSSSGVPEGTVQFFDGNSLFGQALVDASGSASVKITSSVGPHVLAAVFKGYAGWLDSDSRNPVTQLVFAGTTTTIESSLNRSVYGQAVYFTVKVTSPGTNETPRGTVTIKEGSATLYSGSWTSAGVTIGTGALTTGLHTIVASFTGANPGWGPSSGSLAQTVSSQ